MRSKRAGRKGAEDLDPAWVHLQGEGGQSRRVASVWAIRDLYAYQVWAELSKECVLASFTTCYFTIHISNIIKYIINIYEYIYKRT